ncbi:VOC family protein [Pseudoxanthomonas composti]|uniref:VOC family protein n=1 Tax=Pseudoxanthomonas composti TaxID=2137479 RepID=A0A4Q1JZW9_9GAMM|nr:VOC family protein [Pseudoxanthomonas composti]RXR07257.1 VOC family protein [Pseudoxanthomonas composti]
MKLLVNLDVPDLEQAARTYTQAFGLHRGRRIGEGGLELLGAAVPLYLLQQPEGSIGAGGQPRDYRRHWTPVHLDVAVEDLELALARAQAAGLTRETEVRHAAWGSIATLRDPFGHGWCLIQFTDAGYDAIVQ